MKPVLLMKTSSKMSLMFKTCSMVSEEFQMYFGVKCHIIVEGFIDKALGVFIILQYISS